MALRLYNVRTRAKEPFAPRDPSRVGVYVCGLTVYDHAHIGHARTAVSFEVLRRWLERRHPGKVRYVQNVTDVDDKIVARAKERSIAEGREVSPREHAAEWDRICAEQMARLGVRAPDEAPHVTRSVPGIVRFIEGIVGNGFAYATPEGNVYFDVPKYQAHAETAFPGCGYGSLSNRDYREMAAGTRKDVESDKRHPADFALWKAASGGEHPDANWESPWGRGRPGWHIECSHMATEALGEQVDIHGGGQDLIFPHHENEIAQSQAKTGKAPFVHVWMHAGFLNVEGEKMSKSLHNFITLQEALDDLDLQGNPAAALRLYYVQTHYRSKIDYSRKGLAEAATALRRLEHTRSQLAMAAVAGAAAETATAPATGGLGGGADPDAALRKAAANLTRDVDAAMDDDLHTPGALAALFAFQREANRVLDGQTADRRLGKAAAAEALQAYEAAGQALTLFDAPATRGNVAIPDALRQAAAGLGIDLGDAHTDAHAMVRIVDARAAARSGKEWARSDAIRDAAKSAGYLIEDTPAGQRWRRL